MSLLLSNACSFASTSIHKEVLTCQEPGHPKGERRIFALSVKPNTVWRGTWRPQGSPLHSQIHLCGMFWRQLACALGWGLVRVDASCKILTPTLFIVLATCESPA